MWCQEILYLDCARLSGIVYISYTALVMSRYSSSDVHNHSLAWHEAILATSVFISQAIDHVGFCVSQVYMYVCELASSYLLVHVKEDVAWGLPFLPNIFLLHLCHLWVVVHFPHPFLYRVNITDVMTYRWTKPLDEQRCHDEWLPMAPTHYS